MEDTQALYAEILTETSPLTFNQQINIDQAIGQLRQANQTIDLAKEQIQQALQLIGKSSENTE